MIPGLLFVLMDFKQQKEAPYRWKIGRLLVCFPFLCSMEDKEH